MKRSVLLVFLCAAGVARADSGMLPGGADLRFNRLFLHENNNPAQHEPIQQPTSLWHYFNFAHCECSRPGGSMVQPWHEGTFAYEILLDNPNSAQIHAPLEIWVGTMCDSTDPNIRAANCHQIPGAGTSDIQSIMQTNGITPEVPVYDLMEPEPSHMGMGCEQRVLSTAEWAISDINPDGTVGSTPQYFVSEGIQTDSLPPPLPTTFTVSPGESAINISWKVPTGDISDVAYYQVLCADSAGNPVTVHPPAAQYITPRNLCGFAEDLGAPMQPTAIDTGTSTVDAGAIALPPDLAELNPKFICGTQADATATTLRIDKNQFPEGLKNGEPYTVVFLVVDKFGNAAGTFFNGTITPQAVTDFWEDLHDRGSNVKGGFCLIAETYGDDNPLTQALRSFRDDNLETTGFGRWLVHAYYGSLGKLGVYVHGHTWLRVVSGVLLLPLVAIALLWHVLTLPGLLVLLALIVLRRRFRLPRRAWAFTAAGALFVLAPGRAHAQVPYWEDPTAGGTDQTDASALADEENDVDWHVGVRIGPYIPQIDAQLGGPKPGPYEQMFGSKHSWVPMLDVERVVWRAYGQFTVGGTIGYLGKSAHAFVMGSSPSDNPRPRSKGDTTSFNLIPFAITGSYRFTYLDDGYGIPVVPYARVGLAYYAWWITAPDGGFANVMGNKARGASLGIQGSIGIAIRAERIDAEAARSMRASGIYHAGFYGEFQAAKVDGFGSSSKLAVGDSTWFAGIDFEF